MADDLSNGFNSSVDAPGESSAPSRATEKGSPRHGVEWIDRLSVVRPPGGCRAPSARGPLTAGHGLSVNYIVAVRDWRSQVRARGAAATLAGLACVASVFVLDQLPTLPEVPAPPRRADIDLPARRPATSGLVAGQRIASERAIRPLVPIPSRSLVSIRPDSIAFSLPLDAALPRPDFALPLESSFPPPRISLDHDWTSLPGMPRAGDVLRPTDPSVRNPALFRTMYVTFGILQGVDAYTTIRGVSNGAREVNPLMRGVAGSPAGVIAMKAAATAAPIYLAERLRRRSHVSAVVVLAALNSAMAIVVAHNAQNVSTARNPKP